MSLVRSWLQDRLLGRVVKNSSYLFASYVFGAVLTILTAKLLGAAVFGVLGTITVFSSNINRLFSFRMGEMVVKYMGESLAHEDRVRAAAAVKAAMLVEAATSLAAFAALAALAPFGARYVVRDVSTTPLFILYGVSILASIISESSTGVLQVTNHYRSQALINFIQTVHGRGASGAGSRVPRGPADGFVDLPARKDRAWARPGRGGFLLAAARAWQRLVARAAIGFTALA